MIQVKKVMAENAEDDFIEMILQHARRNNMTIQNIREAAAKAICHMESNATLEKEETTEIVKCPYLGCEKVGEVLDDVETAPGVIEKKYVCKEHQGQLVGNIKLTELPRESKIY